MDEQPDLPIRLADPHELQVSWSFRDWLARQAGDRRLAERQLAFLQQWDHLRDEGDASVPAYAARWRVSVATAYRLLDEFRRLFPTEQDPDRLLAMLWQGLTDRHLGKERIGSLMDVRIIRRPGAGLRDLREILPPITNGVLQTPVYDGFSREVVLAGAPYEAYESQADRYAWAPGPSGSHVTFILEGDADEAWLPALGSTEERDDWDQAEMASAARWAQSEGMRLQSVGVRRINPVFRLAPGARPTRRDGP